MAPRKLTQIERWIGTEAERLALDASGFSPGSTFFERDTGSMYKWDGTSWGKEIITVADIAGIKTAIESLDNFGGTAADIGTLKLENGQIKGYDGTDWQPVRVNDEGNLKVSLSGTIQPQWQERIPMFSAGKYTQSQSLVVERPTYAKGAILVVKVSEVSGTFETEEGWATRMRGYWGANVAAVRDLIHPVSEYTSEYLRSGGWSATMIYPQALGDIELYSTTQQVLLHREEMLLGSHVRFELDIKGSFEADDGITIFDSFAYWLS